LDPNIARDFNLQKVKKEQAKQFINFPVNSGISGIVLGSEQGYYYSNHADKETNFVSEIDNQSTTTEIKNFLIGLAIGKDGKPNGII
jgi:hypothetical protein